MTEHVFHMIYAEIAATFTNIWDILIFSEISFEK